MHKEVTQLMQDEGFRGWPYRCTQGFLTVGHGFNIEPGYVHPVVQRMLDGVSYPVSVDRSRVILATIVLDIWERWEKELPDQPLEVRRVLTNMQYQLGYKGVRQFRNMLSAIREQRYVRAGAEMLDSRWATQTPNRVRRLAERMANV